MSDNTPTPSEERSMGKATCRTCGASGPPWKHLPSLLDPNGIGDPGHKTNTHNPTTSRDELEHELLRMMEEALPKNIDTKDEQKLEREVFGDSGSSLAFEKGFNQAITETRTQLTKLIESKRGRTEPTDNGWPEPDEPTATLRHQLDDLVPVNNIDTMTRLALIDSLVIFVEQYTSLTQPPEEGE